MSFRSVSLIAALCGALLAAAGGAHAGTTTLNLGQSAENFTLLGLGPTGTPGFGFYHVFQGAETDTATTATFTLSGVITGSSDPGLASGDYSFVTSYGLGEFILATDASAFSNSFVYTGGFFPDTQMTLLLTNTPTGSHTIPIVTNGMFDGPGFGFSFTSASCTGVAVCTQYNVGQTPGATIAGPVTIGISLAAVPEPATWALAILGMGMIGVAVRRRRGGLAVAA